MVAIILFPALEYYNLLHNWILPETQGAEMCNCHMFALSNAHEYSFSQVPYLKREEKITDLSNFVNDEMLF